MSEETKTVADPEDDVTVVHDDPVAAEEKAHEELVSAVAKKLNSEADDSSPPTEQPDDQSEKPGDEPDDTAGDGEGEKENGEEPSLSQELQTRAKGAGLSDDLAQRLHQSGELEETLAAFDRSMIEYVQSKQTDDSSKPAKDEGQEDQGGRREQQPSPEPPKDQDMPTLDPNVYDEDLIKRDAYQQERIDALGKELEAFRSQVAELVEAQQGGFDEWFDGILTDLGCDTADNDKCQSVFKAYGAMCDAFGTNATARDRAMVERAYAAMYPQDVFKQKQRQTVDRLRDAEGKFVSSSNSKGGPPPKNATDEEVHEQLVSNVAALLKERGVQMSGV